MKQFTQIARSLVTMQSTIRRLCTLSLSHTRAALLFYILVVMSLAMPGSALADDASDLASISERYKELAMGGSDTDVASYLALLNGSGRFTDINYSATCRDCGWDTMVHLERSLVLAQAYEREGGAYYQDASLRSDVFSTISGWVSGTPSNENWWWSTIGWPKKAAEVGVIMKAALVTHNNSLRNSLKSYLVSASWSKIGNQAGANSTDVQLVGLAACAIGDDHNLCETVVNSMLSTVNYKTGDNDGLMTDLSFTQHNSHGRQLYHNGYANVYIYGFLNIATVVRDSSLRVPVEKDTLIEEFFLGGVQNLIYGEHYSDFLVSGRGYAGNPTYTPDAKRWRWPLESLINYGTARKPQLEALHDRMMGVTPEDTVANKMFWHTDFMTHTRPNYYTSVRGTSNRTVGNESLKGQGKLGYHTGDGVNMVLHHGDEYETILPIWDWRRLPGTTIEQRTGSLPLVEGGTGSAGGTSYAGGVSDGKYGAYGFIFNEGSQNANVDAYKAQFFFDDEFVALGAGVSGSNAGNPVVTTANQTLHKSDFTVGGTVSQQAHSSGSVALSKDDWVHHYDIGYLMLDHYGSATASVAVQSGRLSDHTDGLSNDLLSGSVFSLGIDHGQGFSNKTYGYVVVPGVSVSDMSDYAANSPIQVLSNTTSVQAVHHNELDITSALFYQSGSVTMADGSTLTSDKKVAVLVKKDGPYVIVSVASPEYSSMTAKITLDGEFNGDNVSYNSGSDTSTISFSLASGNDKGKTVTQAVIDANAGPALDGVLFNGSFEYGLVGWDYWNGPSIVTDAADGSSAMMFTDTGGASQWVNVTPNSAYTLAFYAKNSDNTNYLNVGINDVDDLNLVRMDVNDDVYTYHELPFITGPNDTQVKVTFWQPSTGNGTAHIDNLYLIAGPGDETAPTPNPASFVVAPVALSASSITMTATTGIDDSPVEYLFSETSGNPGSDGSSGWQSSSTYTASGLDSLTQYTYTVTMRDTAGNTGSASAEQSATTTSNLASNGSFESGLSGWTIFNSPVIVADAFEGASAVQMTDEGSVGQFVEVLPSTFYKLSAYIKTSDGSVRVVLGVNGTSSAGGVDTYGTGYTLVEKIFFTDSDTTQIEIYAWLPPSGGAVAHVDDMKLEAIDPISDTEAPTPNPASFALAPAVVSSNSITMTSMTGSDIYPVEYLFTETSGNAGGTSSSWQSSSTYTDSGLSGLTSYTYTVTMRDTLGNTGSASAGVSATTPGANLILNSGFESGLDDWGSWNNPTVTSDAYEGASAMSLYNKASVKQWITVEPLTTYTYSVYAKINNGAYNVQMGVTDGDEVKIDTLDMYDTQYTQHQITFTTDAVTTSVKLYFWLPPSDNSTAKVDTMSLIQLAPAVDETAPVVSLIGDASMSVVQYSSFTEPGFTAIDNVDGDITASVDVSGLVDINSAGVYPITYTSIDAAGNSASTTRTVTVIAYVDIIDPVITLVGSSSITLEFGETYVEAGATATDNDDGDITANIVISGTVDTSTAGTYPVTYSVSDVAGNSDSVTRTVTVVEEYFDTVAPVITLIGASSISLDFDEAYVEAGATALDNDDGDVTVNIQIIGTVNSSIAGTYPITYSVSDAAGNIGSATRTVTVDEEYVDTVAPVITLNGASAVTLAFEETYVEAGATAIDNDDGDISANIIISGSVNSFVAGDYDIIYDVSDAAGNAASVTRIVTVEEYVPPTVINLALPGNGGTLESFTGEYSSTWGAAKLTNGVTNEDGWASKANPNTQEFIYSFANGDVTLTDAVIHSGTGEGQYWAKDVEVWTSADGSNYTLAASGTLVNSSGQSITLVLSGIVAQNVKLVVTSGYRTDYWEIGEFELNGY